MRRGTFTNAGPVKVSRPDENGEVKSYTQPAYPPRGYWAVVNQRKREAEARDLSKHQTPRAKLARERLARKIGSGEASVQTTVESRRSG